MQSVCKEGCLLPLQNKGPFKFQKGASEKFYTNKENNKAISLKAVGKNVK